MATATEIPGREAPPAVTRYHPALAALHWLMAVLIIAMLFMGFAVLANTADVDPKKIMILRFHMAGGMLILALLIARLIVRWRTAVPPRLSAGSATLDRTAGLVHTAFYFLIFIAAGSGFATAELSGLPQIVIGGSGAPLPDFEQYPSFAVHAVVTRLLAATIVLHTLGALYHYFIVKDGIFRRMGFGGPR